MKLIMKNRTLTLLTRILTYCFITLGIIACSENSEINQSNVTVSSGQGTLEGQWEYLGGDAAHTRYSPANQITADNFEDLEEAWTWDGASFNAQSGRSTPSYINGTLYTVAGARRYVTAINPETGEITTPINPDTDEPYPRDNGYENIILLSKMAIPFDSVLDSGIKEYYGIK